MSLGIKKPGYQLVSLLNPQSDTTTKAPTQQSRLCLLPDQISIYTRLCRVNTATYQGRLADIVFDSRHKLHLHYLLCIVITSHLT